VAAVTPASPGTAEAGGMQCGHALRADCTSDKSDCVTPWLRQ